MKAALGLDVGTTSVKAVVVAENGELVGAGSSGVLQMRAPRPGWAVQAVTDIRSAVIECLTATVESLPDDINVLSLTTAAQSGSVITVDSAGVVADDLTTWMDMRAAAIVEQWHRFGTSVAIRALCGWTVHPGQGLPQLAWLKEDDPVAWAAIGRVGSADDLVMSWLTGMWVTNPSNAAGMALIDVADGQWSHNLCELIDLDATWLSDLRTSGEVIGTLLPEIAELTGLNEDLTVVSGGPRPSLHGSGTRGHRPRSRAPRWRDCLGLDNGDPLGRHTGSIRRDERQLRRTAATNSIHIFGGHGRQHRVVALNRSTAECRQFEICVSTYRWHNGLR